VKQDTKGCWRDDHGRILPKKSWPDRPYERLSMEDILGENGRRIEPRKSSWLYGVLSSLGWVVIACCALLFVPACLTFIGLVFYEVMHLSIDYLYPGLEMLRMSVSP
jgi:hypothetical protein